MTASAVVYTFAFIYAGIFALLVVSAVNMLRGSAINIQDGQ